MEYTENIEACYMRATKREMKEGKLWYFRARKECRKIAIHYEIPLSIVVGVCAALSPNNKWARNLENTSDMVKHFLKGDAVESCRPSTYKSMRDKAWSILTQNDSREKEILKVLNGQKIQSFFNCIMGRQDLCVDGHALNIARNERVELTSSKTKIGKPLYRLLQDSYVEVAKKHGMKAYEMQAITWAVWRREHKIT